MAKRKQHKLIDGVECKWCSKCKQYLPLDEFSHSKASQDGLNFYCKQCDREWHRQHNYGISIEEYNALLKSQNGVCATCYQSEKIEGKSLAVDHIHGSDPIIIRGLLCNRCNRILGYADDSVAVLSSIIEYLKRSELEEEHG